MHNQFLITCTALFILAIILGFLVLLASDLLLGRKASKSAVFRVGLDVSSRLTEAPLLRSTLLLRLLLRLVELECEPEVFLPLLEVLPDVVNSCFCCCWCWGKGVVLPELGALPDVGFLIFLEWDPQVPENIYARLTKNVNNQVEHGQI